MRRPELIALGVALLAAGCAGPEGPQPPAPEEACLLGGPVSQPADNGTVLALNRSHLADHPTIERLFLSSDNPVETSCREALALMEHLASEGADVREGATDFDRRAYLSHDGTTRRVTVQHPR